MERRYQVFVSSTFLDLKEERAAVVSTLLEMDAMPAGMELFPAAEDEPWTLIERVIDSSDYYLLVIGGKYGSIDPATEISYTEKEYDYAVAQRKPVLAFLHADPDAIELGRSEQDQVARKKLDRFREKVKLKKHVKYWKGPEDLAGKVARSFSSFRNTYPAVGWVRGDVQTSTESLSEINDLRKQLERAQAQLRSARSGPPPGAENLAQGSDPVGFAPQTSVRVMTDDRALTITGVISVDITWDEIFSAVGPTLLDEAAQDAVDERVDEWLTSRFRNRARKSARDQVAGEGETASRILKTSVQLTSDDFGTLLIQLRALGLITKSVRKRSVRDTGTYWTLTPYGDEHLTTLRAISREARAPETDAEEADEDS